MTVLILGDQLSHTVGPISDMPDDERVLLIESFSRGKHLPYHPHKLVLVYSAMRHFREELRDEGRQVDYRQVDSFAEGLKGHFRDYPGDTIHMMKSSNSGVTDFIAELVDRLGGELSVSSNQLFICSEAMFDAWADPDQQQFRHESFYRYMRRETEFLMDDGEPIEGTWNFDEQNREFPSQDYEPPEPPKFEPDEITREVIDWVSTSFDGGYNTPPFGTSWADPEPFWWPVTREESVSALDSFIEDRLPQFGPFQDAMLEDEFAMNHSLLSASMNLGHLHPREVIERALDAFNDGAVPLPSAEGFIRQILGWREFVRHVYRRRRADLESANQLGAKEDLPELYWTGNTEMACLSDIIDGVRKRGYSHHIERLMILSNFALIYGVEPQQINRWFRAAYVDAFDWVTTPNVVGMGVFGSDALSTKPYAASANYINKMSDYCGDCQYDHSGAIGEDACPFNSLYWDFLNRNEETLRGQGRMGLVYSHLDRKSEQEIEQIRERADAVRRHIQDTEPHPG